MKLILENQEEEKIEIECNKKCIELTRTQAYELCRGLCKEFPEAARAGLKESRSAKAPVKKKQKKNAAPVVATEACSNGGTCEPEEELELN